MYTLSKSPLSLEPILQKKTKEGEREGGREAISYTKRKVGKKGPGVHI